MSQEFPAGTQQMPGYPAQPVPTVMPPVGGTAPIPTGIPAGYPQQITPYAPSGVAVPPPQQVQQLSAPNLSQDAPSLENSIVVVAYIAYQTSYFKKGVIDSAKATAIYRKFYNEQIALKDGDKKKVSTKKPIIDVNGQEKADKSCELDKNYSAARFRTFCTEEWKKMIKEEYCELVMSEAKAEYFVLKAIVPEGASFSDRSRIVEDLKTYSVASTKDRSLFVVKKSNLISYMAVAKLKSLSIYNKQEDIGKKDVDPDGYILAKKTASKKDPKKANYVIRYVKIDKETQDIKVVTTARQVIHNYAINRDLTENKGNVCKNPDKIVNLAKFQEIFPEITDPCAIYGSQVNYTRKNPRFAGMSEEELKKEKAETIIKTNSPAGKLFEKIGLSEEVVTAMRVNKSKSTSRITLQDMLQESREATNALNTELTTGNGTGRRK